MWRLDVQRGPGRGACQVAHQSVGGSRTSRTRRASRGDLVALAMTKTYQVLPERPRNQCWPHDNVLLNESSHFRQTIYLR